MNHDSTDFAALVGSRICHDLISPVGAIGNGLELIEMSGGAGGPEFDLIADSVGNANARIRFFRIAFGHAAAEQQVSEQEVRAILADVETGSRISYDWRVAGGVPRAQLRAVFLAIMCLETVLGRGGVIEISLEAGAWHLVAIGTKITVESDLWNDLNHIEKTAEITPGRVQFGLLPHALSELEKMPVFEQSDGAMMLRF